MCAFQLINEFHPLDEILEYSDIRTQLNLGYETEWIPQYIRDSAWFENTILAFWLVKILKPKVFVELGTANGFSYMAFCQAAKKMRIKIKCYAIDVWRTIDCYRHQNGEYIYNSILTYNNENYSYFSTILRSTFDDASFSFRNNEIDLLHIDGIHTYEAVKHDYEIWKNKMSNQGIIIFHDINVKWDELNFGVWKFWDEISQEFPSFSFRVGAGLGIIAIGKNYPDQLKYLFSADNDTALKIQSIFGKLGNDVRYLYQSKVELPSVYSSNSWKITAPFRAIRSWLNNLK
jgi:hypothetical protein